MNINFMNGQPSNDILPTELFLKAAQQTFTQPDAAATVLQYGHEYGPLGLRHELSLFLTKEYKSTVSEENLLITPGASLSLQHCLSILTRPGTKTKRVYFQDPTYFLVFDMFLNVGYTPDQFIAIPDTDTGLDIDALEGHLTDTSDGDIYDSVLYCVPSHANPTGSILSDDKRARLVALARKHNMLVICDDVYDILTYKGDVPKRVVTLDLKSEERPVVISNCSFSKLLAPGARVGWIEAHPLLVKKLGACGSFISGGNPATLPSHLVYSMLKDDSLYKHVQYLKRVHSDRLYNGLIEPIQNELEPLGCKLVLQPRGGYFVWLRLPITVDTLNDTIASHHIEVGVGPGRRFRVNSDDPYHVRLSLAHYNTNDLKLGISRLKQAITLALK